MDLNSILPLLLGSSKTDKSDLIKAILGQNGDYGSLFQSFTNKRKNKAEGFTPVLGFVSDDILGIMTRFFA